MTSKSESFSVLLPFRLVNTSNVREHWSQRAKRTSEQRMVTRMALAARRDRWPIPLLPCTVTITRLGKKRMDPDGNVSSMKAVQDGIADALGVDDGSDLVTWVYAQSIGKTYGVRIEIEAKR